MFNLALMCKNMQAEEGGVVSVHPLSETERSSWLAAIQAGRCPICHSDGFKVPALHIYKKHDINRETLNSLLLIARRVSLCDPDTAARHAANINPRMGEGWWDEDRVAAASRKRSEVLRRRFREEGLKRPVRYGPLKAEGQMVEGAPHGTLYGYIDHRCRCDKCREASRLQSRRLRQKWLGEPVMNHGVTGYKRGCRCDECSKAKSEQHRDYLRRQRSSA